MNISDERGRLAESIQLSKEKQIDLARTLKEKGHSNTSIAHIMRLNENAVRTLLEVPQINWGHNCLTSGIHHGRPEAIWNIPLMYAVKIYPREVLEELVISRIYNDAMQFVNRDREFVELGAREVTSYSEEWADRVKEIAKENFLRTLQHKVGELSRYYDSINFRRDAIEVAERVTRDKLNPGYAPLHGHDSINLLCRMLGVNAARQAR